MGHFNDLAGIEELDADAEAFCAFKSTDRINKIISGFHIILNIFNKQQSLDFCVSSNYANI